MGGFELLLFTTDAAIVREAGAAGVAGFVVDWERRGKQDRQAGFDTQIGADDAEGLRRVRAHTRSRVLCRINGVHAGTGDEVEEALAAGADELLVPMVRRPEQVEAVLARVAGRAGVGILIETQGALACLDALARLPLARHLGFAGLTLPEGGRPVPCRLLLAEMARLGADFTMLRRSFLRDTRGLPLATHVPRILAALEEAYARWGTSGIFLSRFLPGLRAAVPPFAGVAGLPVARVLVPAAIASAIWYAFLAFAGYKVAENWDAAKALVADTNRALGAAALVLAAIGAAWLWRRSRRRTG